MDTIRTTAWRRACATSVLACLAGLTLAGCGTYRVGAAANAGTAGHAGTTGHAGTAGIAGYAGTAGRAGQARNYGVMLDTTRSGRPVPEWAVPRLSAIAKRFAKLNGGHALTRATAVLTTHRKALTSATPGDFVPGSGGVPVYLVTMRGHFIAYDVSVPPGASAPTGRYASLVLDARTFDTMDLGIGENPPPVSPQSLGPVTDLLYPRAIG
jgi:hypothetical protein